MRNCCWIFAKVRLVVRLADGRTAFTTEHKARVTKWFDANDLISCSIAGEVYFSPTNLKALSDKTPVVALDISKPDLKRLMEKKA